MRRVHAVQRAKSARLSAPTAALAILLLLTLIVSLLTPGGLTAATPQASAQTLMAQASGISSKTSSTLTLNTTVNTAGTLRTATAVVTNPSRYPVSGATLTVGGTTYRADQSGQNSAYTISYSFSNINQDVTAGTPLVLSVSVIGGTSYGWGLSLEALGDEAGPAVQEVTPEAPTLVDPGQCGVPKTVDIPQVTGVRYESETSADGNTMTVTAYPETGYAFPTGATTSWDFTLTAEACPEPTGPNFQVTGVGGLMLRDINTTETTAGTYSTTANAHGVSTFEKAVVRFSQSTELPTFDFGLTGFSEPTSIESRVISSSADYLEVEFYPVRDGQRIASAALNDGATFTLTSTFTGDAIGAQITLDIYGTTENPPVPLPQSDHQCGTVDGVPYVKKWWRTADNSSGATQNASMLEIKLDNAADIDVNDPAFRVQYGNTPEGFMNLYYGLDFSTRVEGNSLFIIFNNPVQAPTHVYSDFHVFIPNASFTACDDSTLTIWGQDKEDPDTGTPWRKDTDALGGNIVDPEIPARSDTAVDDHIHLLNAGTRCENGGYGMFTEWVNDTGAQQGYLNGDLSLIAVDMGSGIGQLSDYSRLTVTVYPTLNTDSTSGAVQLWPGDYTLRIEDSRLLIELKNPVANNGQPYRAVRIYMGTPSRACGVDAVKLYREAKEVPTRCEAGLTNPLGQAIPYMGNDSTVVDRQPARELTAEEREEGHRVFVASSPTSGQGRYSTQLYYQTQGSATFTKIGAETGWVLNSLAYNPEDNWLYAISQGRVGNNKLIENVVATENGGYTYYTKDVPLEDPCFPAGHLLQINPVTGEVHNLGRVTKPNSEDYAFAGDYDQPWPNDLWGGMTNGFIDADGNFWVGNGSLSGSGALYKINIDQVTGVVGYGNPGDFHDLHSNYRAEDFVALPKTIDGKNFSSGTFAWGLKNSWAMEGDRVVLMRVDLRNGTVTEFDVTGLRTTTGATIETGKQWGKAWTYGDGDLGFGTGSSGANATGVRIKVTNPDSANPTFELVSVENNVPKSYNTDGTSNGAVPLRADLNVVKEFLGVDETVEPARLRWRVTVSNLGPDGSSGFVLTDVLPAELDDLRIEANPNGTMESVYATRDAFQIVFGPLKINQSASLEFSAAVTSGTPAECIPNTVKLIGNEIDPNPDNNTSTAECPPEEPDINIQLQKVDYNDTALQLDASFALFETALDPVDGQLKPTGEGTVLEVPADGVSGTATVQSGKTYFLVETRSPEGYSLLPQPILLAVSRDDQGKAVITFQDQANGFPATIVPSADKDTVTIQIADVSVGELPKTGGLGVGWLALLGALIIASGAFLARRRA